MNALPSLLDVRVISIQFINPLPDPPVTEGVWVKVNMFPFFLQDSIFVFSKFHSSQLT